MAKGEITRSEQFHLLSQCFQKAVCCRGVESVYMRERVKGDKSEIMVSLDFCCMYTFRFAFLGFLDPVLYKYKYLVFFLSREMICLLFLRFVEVILLSLFFNRNSIQVFHLLP